MKKNCASPNCSTRWASTSSKPDFRFPRPAISRRCSEITKIVKRASVCGLARAGFKDIDRAGEALKGAQRPRIHTFISTSPVHMKHKLNMGENAVLEAIGASVTRARNFTSDVQWSAEDATRTVPDFLCRCVEVAIHSGATTINIPDTVGYSTPQEYFDIITMLRNRVPNADKVIFSTHCHNDLGLAVANSLAGVLAGARPGGMHHQRHRRARRQCRAGRDRDGAEGAQGHHALRHQHQHHHAGRGLQAGLERHRLSGPVQQGDRGQERLQP